MDNPHFITPPAQWKPVVPPPSAQPISPPPSAPPPQPHIGLPKSPRGRFGILKIILLVLAVVIVAIIVAVFFIFLQGKTSLGAKFQDKIWERMIEDVGSRPIDQDFKFAYQDKGKFDFVPSQFAKDIDWELSAEEAAEYDKDYSFTLSDMMFQLIASGFSDFEDTTHPKADAHLDITYNNDGQSYHGTTDLKVKDKNAFVKYEYSDSIKDYLLSKGALRQDLEEIEKYKNVWLKLPEDELTDDLSESFNSLSPLGSARAKSRNAKRVADARQIASALELYFNDNNSYPERLEDLNPTYLVVIPNSPTPPDGKCTDEYNNYRYSPVGSKKESITYDGRSVTGYFEYQMIFCIGQDTGGLKAGNQILTETGIDSYTCPEGQKCEIDSARPPEESPYRASLKRNRLFNIKSFKGVGMVSGKPVLHYAIELNEAKLRNVMLDSIKDTLDSDYEEYKDFVDKFLNTLLDKFEMTEYEIWVNPVDQKVYKTHIVTTALSAAGSANLIMDKIRSGQLQKDFGYVTEPVQTNARDAQRVADMRQMASALELYYNENNGYPAGQNGKPNFGNNDYLPQMPTAPTPVDGNCNDYYNTYWYEPVGSPQGTSNGVPVYSDYSMTFCIGGPTGGIEDGINKMTSRGVEFVMECPPDSTCNHIESPEPPTSSSSLDSDERFENVFLDYMRQLPWDATITIDSTIKSQGTSREVDLPAEYEDLGNPDNSVRAKTTKLRNFWKIF